MARTCVDCGASALVSRRGKLCATRCDSRVKAAGSWGAVGGRGCRGRAKKAAGSKGGAATALKHRQGRSLQAWAIPIDFGIFRQLLGGMHSAREKNLPRPCPKLLSIVLAGCPLPSDALVRWLLKEFGT